MRNIFVFIFSFMLIFSSSCAMKKLAVHQFESSKNIPTKTSPFSKEDIFSTSIQSCTFKKHKNNFTDNVSPFIVQTSQPKYSGTFSGIGFFLKTNLLPPVDCIVFKTKKYSFSTDTERLYLKLGRIIYYA